MLTNLKSDLEVDINDKLPLEALSNPTSPYKLVTKTYNTLEDLESDFCQFIASASFNIVYLKALIRLMG